MGENSKIEWTDSTFNPWIGCQAVSAACDHCYAERQVNRFGDFSVRRRTSPANWREPVRWNKAAAAAGVRHRVFCASFADVFDNQVPIDWRVDLWTLIANTPHLDWLLLTKRPQNIKKMLPAAYVEQMLGRDAPWGDEGWPNVWLGTTVENQEEANRRIPALLDVPARVHFLSCEPLLGPLDLTAIKRQVAPGYFGDCLQWYHQPRCEAHVRYHTISWVICGGESGPKARPMHPDWARGLRDQCAAADVPFFFKQWGDWADIDGPHGVASSALGSQQRTKRDIYLKPDGTIATGLIGTSAYANSVMRRMGKKNAGRMLDGRTWDETPKGAA